MPATTAKRPLSFTIVGWLFIVTGVGGFIAHARSFSFSLPFESDMLWACGLSVLAVIGGIFLLRGDNWARWLCVAWMGFHVIISAFHSVSEVAVHALLFAAIAFFLFRPRAAAV
jgi:hypothetical protein